MELKRQNKALEDEVAQLRSKLSARPGGGSFIPEIPSVGIPDPLALVPDVPQDIGSVTYSSSTDLSPQEYRLDSFSSPVETGPEPHSSHMAPLFEPAIFSSDLITTNSSALSSVPPSNSWPMPTFFFNQPSTKFWELPILLGPPENVIDGFLVSILHQQRASNIGHLPLRRHSPRPNLRALLHPQSTGSSDFISSTITSVVHSAGILGLAEQIASLYSIYKIVQWQIWPCLKTYEEIPSWLAPVPAQLTSAHPCWVSQMKFPKLRDQVIKQQHLYANNTFLYMYTTSLRVNWPYRDADIFRIENGNISVSPVFEKHIAVLENWSLTEPFTLAYPELQWTCRFTSSPQPRWDSS